MWAGKRARRKIMIEIKAAVDEKFYKIITMSIQNMPRMENVTHRHGTVRC